jgi:hypothetical protein
MFDWPKQTKIQKLVSWENPFSVNNNQAASRTKIDFIFMLVGFDVLLEVSKIIAPPPARRRRRE